MADLNHSIPVRCPTCGVQSLSEFPIMVIVTALLRWNQMALYASCHDTRWDASAAELAEIREYLGAAWIEANRGTLR